MSFLPGDQLVELLIVVALVAGVGTGALGLGLAFAMHLDWIWGACVGALVAVIALATQWEDRRAAS